MLPVDSTILVLVDVQGKLAQLMHERELLVANLGRMVRGAQVLGIPIIWNEQVPEKLGPTIPEVAELLTGLAPLPKNAFSCCGNPAFVDRLEETGRRQVVLVGIETHVCVYQTARDLLSGGYAVEVVADAVSSRTEANWRIGLDRVRQLGGGITSTEMVLFELLGVAEGERFRAIQRAVK
ncbi:MAG: hydrolase [Actinomycetales bacterium]|nr:hydrolase [Actinomycetales bacterium]